MIDPATGAHFVELDAAAAVCRSDRVGDRACARRLLVGRGTAPPVAPPAMPLILTSGRVYGAGRFRNEQVRAALIRAMPAPLGPTLRLDFEWYACRGAFFHNDAHYDGVLFGAWCVAGPARDLAFARARTRVPAAPKHWVVFDPFEPHAVLESGASRYQRDRYASAPVSLFIGFEIELTDVSRALFGIESPAPGAVVLSSQIAVNAETGALT